MNPYIKYCSKCKLAFDIATNFEICPTCRLILAEEWERKELKKREREDD